MKETKIYNIDNTKELKECERKQENLYNKYNNVKVVIVGLNKVKIIYGNEVLK
jgi:hypothetical protein